MATFSISYGTYAAVTVTNLQSLANDATDPFGGWQSARISNLSDLALNREFVVDLSTAATAAGVLDRAGAVDERVLARVDEQVEDRLWRSRDDALDGEDVSAAGVRTHARDKRPPGRPIPWSTGRCCLS